MVLPGRFSQGTPAWYDNPTMPSFEDYADDPDGYDAAVSAWVASQNGGPAGNAPSYDPVTGFSGAGSQRMADMSQGEYAANYLNSRIQSAANQVANGNPDHPNAKMLQLALSNRASIRPEEFQSAYQAATQGTAGPSPILSDTALNFLESLGYGPPPPPSGPSGGPLPTDPFVPPDVVPLPHPGGDYSREKPGQLPPTMRPKPGPTLGPTPSQGGDFTNRNPPLPGIMNNIHHLNPGPPGGPTMPTGPGWYDPNDPFGIAHYGPMPPGMVPIQQSPDNGAPPVDGSTLFPNMNPFPTLNGGGQVGNPDVRSRFEEFKRARQGQTPPYLPTGLAGY